MANSQAQHLKQRKEEIAGSVSFSWTLLKSITMCRMKSSDIDETKNYKACLNLCHHKSDFDIDTTWAFFAKSHWKSLCDRIGGTVKCKILCANLQRPVNNQILAFHAIKEYCKSSIEGITFLTIDKEDVVAVRENLKSRYELDDTVPGSRSCHHFVPTSSIHYRGKRLEVLQNTSLVTIFLRTLYSHLVITYCLHKFQVLDKTEVDIKPEFSPGK